MPSVFRTFIAVEINDLVRQGLHDLQRRLRKAEAQVGWVLPENAHLTLAFLGDTLEESIPLLARVLDTCCDAVAPFPYHVEGLGLFGRPRAPRVAWVGLRATPPELAVLHQSVREAVVALGFPQESRPFVPHITIGRIKSLRHVAELTSAIASSSTVYLGEVRIERLLLMRSHQDEPKARYSVLHESQLKGSRPHG